jgi:hypothetical protein
MANETNCRQCGAPLTRAAREGVCLKCLLGQALAADLRFPGPPFRIEPSVVEQPPPHQALSSYLDQIRLWRLAVLRFLDESTAEPAPAVRGLSERARSALATFLASQWSRQTAEFAARSPYNLSPFPASALEAGSLPTVDAVLDVLRWRAGVLDMLSDIYDVIGESDLDLRECVAIGQFLRPRSDEQICDLCLTAFAPDQLHPDQHRCLLISHVRAKWPALPPSWRRWAEEARQAEDAAQAEMPSRRRWWQFWK